MTTATLNHKEIENLVTINEQLARSFLIDFIEYNDSAYQTIWYHQLICNTLDDLINGKISKLMVFMPPQHGKSLIISQNFPAYLLGRSPKCNIVSCSYSADLAQKFNRKVQRLIDTPQYKKLFPETQLNSKNVANDSKGSWLRNTEVFEIVKYGGSYKAVGVEGSLTGNPVDVGIIDDPVKDAIEAQSSTTRNRNWEWYNDVFRTRLHNRSKQILVMTRWNEDDLAGRILSHEHDWKVISLPAIKEDNDNPLDPRLIGDALWPDRHSIEKIESIKRASERTFISLYQQRPAPAEGALFKRSWFKFYNPITGIPPRFETVIQSWDCTFKDLKTSDFVVGSVWGKIGANTYLLDIVRGQWSFTDTIKQMNLLIEKYPEAGQILIEDKANGTAIIEVLRDKIPGIIPIVPTESKESRASAISYVIEAGNVYFPEDQELVSGFIEELASFPNAKHDDMVDSMTQALNRLYSGYGIVDIFTSGDYFSSQNKQEEIAVLN